MWVGHAEGNAYWKRRTALNRRNTFVGASVGLLALTPMFMLDASARLMILSFLGPGILVVAGWCVAIWGIDRRIGDENWYAVSDRRILLHTRSHKGSGSGIYWFFARSDIERVWLDMVDEQTGNGTVRFKIKRLIGVAPSFADIDSPADVKASLEQ